MHVGRPLAGPETADSESEATGEDALAILEDERAQHAMDALPVREAEETTESILLGTDDELFEGTRSTHTTPQQTSTRKIQGTTVSLFGQGTAPAPPLTSGS